MKKLLYILLACCCLGCKHKTNVAPVVVTEKFSNVLILGNSITYTPANPAIGWNGNWGMAASTAAQDYVHLLTAKFQSVNKNCAVNGYNISNFELDYANYDFDANLKAFRDTKPDLVIIRIGENVQPAFDATTFDKQYKALVAYFKVNNPNVKVLTTSSFWPQRDYVNAVMSNYSPYVSLTSLGLDNSNYAFYLTSADPAVQGHPGDKGMQAIADAIWAKVQTL